MLVNGSKGPNDRSRLQTGDGRATELGEGAVTGYSSHRGTDSNEEMVQRHRVNSGEGTALKEGSLLRSASPRRSS